MVKFEKLKNYLNLFKFQKTIFNNNSTYIKNMKYLTSNTRKTFI